MTTRKRQDKNRPTPKFLFGSQLYSHFSLPANPNPKLAFEEIGWKYLRVAGYPGTENRLPFFRGYALPVIAVTPSSSHNGFYIHIPTNPAPDDTFIQCHGFFTPDNRFSAQEFWKRLEERYNNKNFYQWDEFLPVDQSDEMKILRRSLALSEDSEATAAEEMDALILQGNENARQTYKDLSKREEFEIASLALKKLSDRINEMDIDEIPPHVIPLWAKTFAELRRLALEKEGEQRGDGNINIIVTQQEAPVRSEPTIDLDELRDG